MKKIILILGVMLIFSMSGFYASASTTEPVIDSITVEIKPFPTKNPPVKPRSIVDNDIEATYYAGALTLIFNNDLGNADIVVCNHDTGDVWCGSINGMGIEALLLSGEDGYYTITIYTDNGEYYGEMWL